MSAAGAVLLLGVCVLVLVVLLLGFAASDVIAWRHIPVLVVGYLGLVAFGCLYYLALGVPLW